MKPVLLDTGVIVALFDRSESHHKKVIQVLDHLSAPLITCEAVIAEACYLLRRFPQACQAIVLNVERGTFQIPLDLALSARRIRQLLKSYADLSIDLADACLISMAEEFESGKILTLDSDFRYYRWAGKRHFENLMNTI